MPQRPGPQCPQDSGPPWDALPEDLGAWKELGKVHYLGLLGQPAQRAGTGYLGSRVASRERQGSLCSGCPLPGESSSSWTGSRGSRAEGHSPWWLSVSPSCL